jgi:RNA polymerase sigma-70 factor (ECF subfamily)
MTRYQQADTEAAGALIDVVSPQFFRFFLGCVGDRFHAEDLLQDFWLRMHQARRTYRPPEPVLPWMYAIARRVRVDDYRRRKRVSLTFALNGHFRWSGRRILFAFNGGSAETDQVKTLPLF